MVTIFTPTYNRVEMLKKLVQSLENQTDTDFEWLIVDDGSSDGTEAWVHEYKKKSKINIRYYIQENSGKHIAYNKAIIESRGEVFFCVDSDDYLTNNAIYMIKDYIDRIKNKGEIGLIFPQMNENKKKIGSWEKMDGKILDIIDFKEVYGISETAIIIKSDVLKKYRFKKFRKVDGSYEKFCPEGVLYNKLIKEGKFLVVNKECYISEYQEDGLTNNLFNNWIENYNGVLLELQERFKAANKYNIMQRFKTQSKCILNINALCIRTGCSIAFYTPSRFMSRLLYIPGIIFYYYRFK